MIFDKNAKNTHTPETRWPLPQMGKLDIHIPKTTSDWSKTSMESMKLDKDTGKDILKRTPVAQKIMPTASKWDFMELKIAQQRRQLIK